MNRIENSLSYMITKLKSENSCGKTAYNKTAETIMCGLLNRMYGTYHFENVNTAGKQNFPGIDLISADGRTGVQITTQNTAAKVDRTIQRVKDHEECSSISRLIILVLTFDNSTPTMKLRKADRWFKGSEDIWNLSKLAAELESEKTDVQKLKEIAAYLEQEIGGTTVQQEMPAQEQTVEPAEQVTRPVEKVPAPEMQQQGKQIAQQQRRRRRRPQKKSAKRARMESLLKVGPVVVVVLLVIISLWLVPGEADGGGETTPKESEPLMWARVEDILREAELEQTAVPLSACDPGLNGGGNLYSTRNLSVAYPFTLQCAQLAANPISAFNAVKQEYLEPEEEAFVLLTEYPNNWVNYLYRIPSKSAGEWEWSVSGVKAFLTDMLEISAKCDDGFDLDNQFLTALRSSHDEVVHFSAGDQCYYVYFIYYGDNSSHMISMYFHADQENGNQIADVEVQFLSMRYCVAAGAGGVYSLELMDNENREQALSMIMSIEHLMAGDSCLDASFYEFDMGERELSIPAEYRLGDYEIAMKLQSYESAAYYGSQTGRWTEHCELLTYRIRRSDS